MSWEIILHLLSTGQQMQVDTDCGQAASGYDKAGELHSPPGDLHRQR